MAIVQEKIGDMWHTYSDKDMFIHGGKPEADYEETYDSEQMEYTETDKPIKGRAPSPEAEQEEYYMEAGKILLGEGA